jgi:hypothetical protein
MEWIANGRDDEGTNVGDQPDKNGEYLAACQPQTILRLIAAARQDAVPENKNGCAKCGEPIYLSRFGYTHADTTLNVECVATPKPTHEHVPKDGPEDAQLRAFGIDPLKLASNFRKRLEEEVANGARLTPRMLEAMRQFGCKIPESASTLGVQTAAGEGELRLMREVEQHRKELIAENIELKAQRDRAIAQRDEAERDKAFAGEILGKICVYGTLISGERPVNPPPHAAVDAILTQIARAEAAEAKLAAATEFKLEGGCSLIAAERVRQISGEGWTPEHDDQHSRGEMQSAAADYLAECKRVMRGHDVSLEEEQTGMPWGWPWDRSWWKPSPDPIRNLVKAGALIAAEIDRLSRLRSIPSEPAGKQGGAAGND